MGHFKAPLGKNLKHFVMSRNINMTVVVGIPVQIFSFTKSGDTTMLLCLLEKKITVINNPF